MVKDSKIQLVEIKKGQTGTGLLLENDGYMSLDMPENKILKESIDEFNNGMANDLPKPFVVSAQYLGLGGNPSAARSAGTGRHRANNPAGYQ